MDAVVGKFNKTMVFISGEDAFTLFSVQKAMLNLLGFNWFPGGVNLPLPTFIKHTLHRILCPVWMVTVAVCIIVYVFSHEVVTQLDFILKINGYIVAMTLGAATFKSLVFHILRKEMRELFRLIENLGPLDTDSKSTKSHFQNCFLYILLILMNPTLGCLWALSERNELPFKAAYPWEDKGVLSLVSSFLNLSGATFCGLTHILVDTTFMMSITGIILQVDNLSQSLSNLGKHRFKDTFILSAAVDKHTDLLKVSQHLSLCYSNLFVAQSLYNVVHSCVLLFGAVHVDSKGEVAMSHGTMLMTSYAQLWVYCYYGELLTSKFSDLLFDSYNNVWYDSELRVKKALPKFASMCHRQVSLRGFGKVQPSKNNWLQSLQESVSYFLFLKTISGED